MHKILLTAVIALTVFAGSLAATPPTHKEPLDANTLDTIRSEFSKLMELANRHDFKAPHEMFWQSPSTLLVAKNAIPSEGNWAGFWATRLSIRSYTTSAPLARSSSNRTIRSSRSSA